MSNGREEIPIVVSTSLPADGVALMHDGEGLVLLIGTAVVLEEVVAMLNSAETKWRCHLREQLADN